MKYFLMMAMFCVSIGSYGCTVPAGDQSDDMGGMWLTQKPGIQSNNTTKSGFDYGGVGAQFKVPVPKGEKWEITQSWAEHCEECNNKGYDTIYNNFFGNFCEELSHATTKEQYEYGCFGVCKYGWDFNLPGTADLGKPALASGNGKVKSVGKNGWGNYVTIDHGDNICTRYAHLKDDSIMVSEGQEVCQGMKVGEIGDTGGAVGAHLHFQFEECSTQTPLRMGFDDGNGVPVCTMGEDVNDAYGNYDFLILSNSQVDKCGEGPSTFGGAELYGKGWLEASCGTLPSCPMIPNCNRQYGYRFLDHAQLDGATASAALYLYSECVLNGKADGRLHAQDDITRAEALKVALHLFGLSENCGSNVPFQDVKKKDWFYETVACGVKHGIISANNASFHPNMPVSMGEAAKMLVESASGAGVINSNKQDGHFSKVNSSHWAYGYLRTLYYYGGLGDDMLNKSAEDKLNRGRYVVMAASLSPCYCGNVSCESGCVCDQSAYACVDPQDVSPGTGGAGSEDDDEDEPEQNNNGGSVYTNGSKEYYNQLQEDLGIECEVNLDQCRCESGKIVLYIECKMSNGGAEEVKVKDLLASSMGEVPGQECHVTDPTLSGGAGFQNISSGESKALNGHFEVSCSQMPVPSELWIWIELVQKVDGSADLHHKKIFGLFIPVPQQPFNNCAQAQGGQQPPQGGQQPPQGGQPANNPWANWVCDPAVGYTVHVASAGGSYLAIAPSTFSHISGQMEAGFSYPIIFDCVDLPGAVFVHGGPQGLQAWRPDASAPPFAVWFPYDGIYTINPPYNPDVTVPSFASGQANTNMLIRIPPP